MSKNAETAALTSPGGAGLQKHAAGRHFLKRGVDQFVLAAEGAQHGLHRDSGALRATSSSVKSSTGRSR